MCGIYAAINAMHRRGEIKCLDEAAIPFRLAMMFMQSREDWNLAEATCFGIGEKEYLELLMIMSWRDWEHVTDADYTNADYDLHEELKKLFSEENNEQKVASVIVSLVYEGAEPYVTEQERDVKHYTVITGVTDKSITICNSQEHEIEVRNDGLYYDGDRVQIGSLYVMYYRPDEDLHPTPNKSNLTTK